MAADRFTKKIKSVWVKGKFADKEELIRVAKNQAKAIGLRGTFKVVDIGDYIADRDGQSVAIEGFGREYDAPGGRRRELTR